MCSPCWMYYILWIILQLISWEIDLLQSLRFLSVYLSIHLSLFSLYRLRILLLRIMAEILRNSKLVRTVLQLMLQVSWMNSLTKHVVIRVAGCIWNSFYGEQKQRSTKDEFGIYSFSFIEALIGKTIKNIEKMQTISYLVPLRWKRHYLLKKIILLLIL